MAATAIMLNAFTIDWEDWYQGLTSTSRCYDDWDNFDSRLARNTDKMLGMLAECDVHATFFVLGHAARQFPRLVRRIYANGHEIAVHSYRHRLVYEITPDEFRRDTLQAMATVQDIIGGPVYGYRAPAFSIVKRSAWALEILCELGIRYDSSVFPGQNMLYGWPGSPRFPYRPTGHWGFIEAPVSTIQLGGRTVPMGGGFYLRALPLSFVQWSIDQLHRQGHPVILYTHPWELDPCQPRPAVVTTRERVSHYMNLDQTERKLRALLSHNKFTTTYAMIQSLEPAPAVYGAETIPQLA
jgi:polysaccharide deacetylase family protein (PEP-CTERM system associated)